MDWLIGMVCPVCGDAHLTIEHELTQPDQMSCNACTTTFEVAQDGETVRLVRYPSHLPAELRNGWFKPSAITRIAYQAVKQVEPLIAASAPVVDLPVEERVKKLARLGNPPEKIRAILSRQPGIDIDMGQVDAVLATYQKQNKGSATWSLVLGGLVVVLAIVVIAVLLLQSAPPANLASQANPDNPAALQPGTKATADSPYLDPALLPAPLRTLIPSGMAILKPTPVVVHSLDANTQPTIKCPVSPGQAADVFGGEMEEWTKSDAGGAGWYIISTQSRTIHLPKNMTGGYFEFINSPSMNSVVGPAVIENVFFMSISCE